MKTLKFTFSILLAILLLVGCKKEDSKESENDISNFDIHNPEEYCIYFRDNGGIGLITFNPGKLLNIYSSRETLILTYTVVDANTVETMRHNGSSRYIKIVDGKVTLTMPLSPSDALLIKKPKSNYLTGKTFTGTYYYPNGSVFQNSYFYSFTSDKISAGTVVGNPDYTGDYISIANIAALNDKAFGSSGRELAIWVNGKLEVNCFNNDGTLKYRGTFIKR